jgi:hypothetical protein
MQSEQINELVAALVAAQSKFPVIEKGETADIPTKNGGSYSYKYADIAAIAEKINPILSANGLAVSQAPSVHVSGQPSLTTTLLHVSGQWISSEMLLQIGTDAGAQAQGSAITYARRYAKSAVLDLVTDSDDDGAAASTHGGKASDGQREPSGPRAEDVAIILKGASLAPDNTTLNDIAGKWHKYGKLSDKQIDFALDLAEPYVQLSGMSTGPITPEDSERQSRIIKTIQGLTESQKSELSALWDEEKLPSVKKGMNSTQLDAAERIVRRIANLTGTTPSNYDSYEEPY